jgi:phosphoglycolate phosphatase
MFPPKPRAILFDWDNTLVDTWPCIAKATNITLQTMGHVPWTDEQVRERVAGSLRDTFPRIYGDRWEEARQVYYRAFEQVHLEMLCALPGAADVLAAARASGAYMALVSNKTGKYLRAEVAHLGWTAMFGRAIGAQDAPRDKPALDPVHMAMDGSGVELGADVWFVGDAGIDVECGQAAGCTTVLVQAQPYEGAHRPHHLVSDCYELVGLIDRAARPSA